MPWLALVELGEGLISQLLWDDYAPSVQEQVVTDS